MKFTPYALPPGDKSALKKNIVRPADVDLMKLAMLVSRGSKKDFIDLYFLSRQIPMARLLNLADKKFKDRRDFRMQVLKALVYFEDADKEPTPRMHRKISWDEIKLYFEKLAHALLA